jgi:hypothetical protein
MSQPHDSLEPSLGFEQNPYLAPTSPQQAGPRFDLRLQTVTKRRQAWIMGLLIPGAVVFAVPWIFILVPVVGTVLVMMLAWACILGCYSRIWAIAIAAVMGLGLVGVEAVVTIISQDIVRGLISAILLMVYCMVSAVIIQRSQSLYYTYQAMRLLKQGDATDALMLLHGIIALQPDDAAAYFNRAIAYMTDENISAARADFDRAVALAPDSIPLRLHRGRFRLLNGDCAAAIEDFETIRKARPREYLTLALLAMARAGADSAELRNGAYALELSEESQRIARVKFFPVLSATAMAHAELGQFNSAVDFSRQAIQASDDFERPREEARLFLYKQGKPFRFVKAAPPLDYQRAASSEPEPNP